MAITSNKIVSDHLEALMSLLEFSSSDEAMKKRIEIIEQNLAAKDADAKVARPFFLKETAFMIKNKKKIIALMGEDKYIDIFSNSVKFLESNPEPRVKKENKLAKEIYTIATHTVPLSGHVTFNQHVTIGGAYDPSATATITLTDTVAQEVTTQAGLSRDVLRRLSRDMDLAFEARFGGSPSYGDPVDFESVNPFEEQPPPPEEGENSNE